MDNRTIGILLIVILVILLLGSPLGWGYVGWRGLFGLALFVLVVLGIRIPKRTKPSATSAPAIAK